MIYAIGILVVVLGLYGWHCESVKREYATFVSQVEAAGKKAVEEARKKTADDLKAKENADVENARLRADNAALAKRLRNARASRSSVPSAPASAKRPHLAIFDRTQLDGALRQLDEGISDIVAEGDAARIDLDSAKKWSSSVLLQRPRE